MGRYLEVAQQSLAASTKETKKTNYGSAPQDELLESMRRLEVLRFTVAIRADGSMLIEQGPDTQHEKGTVRFSARDMYVYVHLSESERRALYRFRKQFPDSQVEWKPQGSE